MSRTAVTGLTAITLIGTIFFVFSMFTDINHFYEDALKELEEFKDVSNAAWKGMMPNGLESILRAPRSVHRYHRRQAGQCNCGAQSSGCPGGSPGSPGQPGAPGEDGHPGDSGKPGNSGKSVALAAPGSGCIQCFTGPAGAPGPAGPAGNLGAPRSDGQPGGPGQTNLPALMPPTALAHHELERLLPLRMSQLLREAINTALPLAELLRSIASAERRPLLVVLPPRRPKKLFLATSVLFDEILECN